MELKKFGDWGVVTNMAKNMSSDIKHSNKIALAQIALRAEAMAVKHLRDQDLKWKPLSKKYIESKRKKGLSDKTLIATSSYMQAITSDVNQAGTASSAGVFRKSKGKNGENIADIAKTMEYGSIVRNIPARPLWKPVYSEMKKWLIKMKFFASAAVEEIGKRTGGKGMHYGPRMGQFYYNSKGNKTYFRKK